MRIFIAFFIFFAVINIAWAQQNAAIGTTTPSAKAIFEIKGPKFKGLFLPRFVGSDTTSFLASPGIDRGLMFYDTTGSKFYTWNGNKWLKFFQIPQTGPGNSTLRYNTANELEINNNIVVTSTGKTGINSTSPLTRLEVKGALTFAPDVIQNITTDLVTINVNNQSYIRLRGNDGTFATRNFVLTNGLKVGQILTLEGVLGSGRVGRLADGNSSSGNTDLAGVLQLSESGRIMLIWNGSYWMELSRSAN